MAVPPFPSLELAKLVLGYLAEEQLMTAYDEFLQASPYLDALQNEYDRVCMTSLSSILADYRAVKIYVETCKPLVLRKKLVKCSNLLDVFKNLVNYVDYNKIISQEIADKPSVDKQYTKSKVACEACNTQDHTKCLCKSKNCLETSRKQTSRLLESTVESSVEATSLRDLPGHLVSNDQQINASTKSTNENCHVSTEATTNNTNNSVPSQPLQNIILPVRTLVAAQQNQYGNQGNQAGIGDRYMYPAGSFQDFTTGIRGPDSGTTNVPDSSTSENIQDTTKESIPHNTRAGKMTIIIRERKAQNKSNVESATNYSPQPVQHLKETRNLTSASNKNDEQKVTILSDVKVDQVLSYDGSKQLKMPQILNNATSTPLFQMQSILINGIPAYRHVPMLPFCPENYTKDEIMAMPTIIVAPTSTSSVPSSTCQTVTEVKTLKPRTSDNEREMAPLVIDVEQISPIESTRSQLESNAVSNSIVSNIETGLVKTVDMKQKNSSMPKDSVVISPGKVSTPQVLPPLRKSSSTPRRSSHIRVLDFKTPRKILHETISENNQEEPEVVLGSSPNLANVNLVHVDGNVISTFQPRDANVAVVNADLEVVKENVNTVVTPATLNKTNWDADLRALIGGSASKNSKTKPKKPTKKKTPTKKITKKSKTESNKSKKKGKDKLEAQTTPAIEIIDVEDVAKEIENKSNVKSTVPVVKPTINIIDKNAISQENSSKKDKSVEEKRDKSSEDCVETPEAERLSLQNVIGARLNISEFLETPYKQALYDIQMETPKFLGPDIPGDPLSDIKIMNIPTPRFLTSPTLAQATPSSYSSRPTDYSSSGSYYKPDDQEYIPSAEILGYDASNINVRDSDTSESNPEQGKTKSRPVRQCTKNVSYSSRTKNKDSEQSDDTVTSENIKNRKISTDSKSSKDAIKPIKETKVKENKPDTKKKTSSVRKRKTPVEKVTSKSFMKIKPRKCSPLKTPKSKEKLHSSPIKSSIKKATHYKDKIKLNTPTVAPVPTKSRRKSSTPRKLHSAKTFHSESSGHNSPDLEAKENKPQACSTLDSDTDQIALRWSDDGSQDINKKKEQVDNADGEDITKIQEYIAKSTNLVDNDSNLRMDSIVNRIFDAESAKIIERDLLGRTPDPHHVSTSHTDQIVQQQQDKSLNDKNLESDSSNLQIVQDEDDEEMEEVEWSVSDCNQDDKSVNYIELVHDDSKEPSDKEPAKLKDTFTMEVNIDDGVTVRCRLTEFITHFDKDPDEISYTETQLAIASVTTNFSTLYTPLKDAVRAKCHEIFDSTLTSLDTPLKATSPKVKEHENSLTDLVLEAEKVFECKEKTDSKKRKRQSALNIDEANDSKKAKPDTPYVLNPANIQNFDIESVLKQLHGS